VFVDYDVTY